ncbi:hypothetical protein LTR08_001292 [Meristemomyces frigidus]|nr:hypothetical protein LTR08_001292 [Meristemomyces frigidus]
MSAFATVNGFRPITPAESLVVPMTSGALLSTTLAVPPTPFAPLTPRTVQHALALPIAPHQPLTFASITNRHSAIIARQPSISSQRLSKRDRLRARANRTARAIGRVVKRVFSGTNKPGFVMPGEYASLRRWSSRSSMCSRRSAVRISRAITPEPAAAPAQTPLDSKRSSGTPSVFVTSPSNKRRTYILHEHFGPVSEAPPIRKSVLFGMPAISAIHSAPLTPLTAFTSTSIQPEADLASPGSLDARAKFVRLDGGDSTPITSPMSADFAGQVQPKTIVRKSGFDIEADPAGCMALMDAVDGIFTKKAIHKLPNQAQTDRDALPSQRPTQVKQAATELPYMAYVPTTATLGESSALDASLGAERQAGVAFHRRAALAQLQSSAAAPVANVVPRTVAFPDTLLPGQQPIKSRPVAAKRPHTTGGLYVTFTGPFDPYGDASSSPTNAGAAQSTTESGSDSGSDGPDFTAPVDHQQHYSRVECGLSNSPWPTRDDSLPSSPSSPFSTASGSTPVPLPSPPAPPTIVKQIKRKPVGAGSAVAGSSTAPGGNSSAVANSSRELPVDVNKLLPPAPSAMDPRRYTGGVVPQSLAMNGNAYPLLNRAAVAPSARKPVVKPAQATDFMLVASTRSQATQEKKEQRKKAHRFCSTIGKLF